MEIIRFKIEDKAIWNDFILRADNGHFMFHRDYMDYHEDRFKDHSLMFLEGGKLMGLLPANEIETVLYSHAGLTFGGLVVGPKAYTSNIMEMFSALSDYISDQGFRSLVYKVMPWIFNRGTREEHLYALNAMNAVLSRRDISSVIDLKSQFKYRSTKKQNIAKAIKVGLCWKELSDINDMWALVSEVLEARHDSVPTHSLEEIELLRTRFSENIKAYGVFNQNEILGGALVFINRSVVHTQYLAVNEEGRALGALDFLIDRLIQSYREEMNYFSFGISTEDQGRVLNKGLIFQKEGFGARGMVHDFYRLEF